MTPMNQDKIRELEQEFAYLHATGIIESSCTPVEAKAFGLDAYDLATAEVDISEEVAYLESRSLLQHHPDHPTWVILCDEGEPCL